MFKVSTNENQWMKEEEEFQTSNFEKLGYMILKTLGQQVPNYYYYITIKMTGLGNSDVPKNTHIVSLCPSSCDVSKTGCFVRPTNKLLFLKYVFYIADCAFFFK